MAGSEGLAEVARVVVGELKDKCDAPEDLNRASSGEGLAGVAREVEEPNTQAQVTHLTTKAPGFTITMFACSQ